MSTPYKASDAFSAASALESQCRSHLPHNATTASLSDSRTIRTVTIGTMSRLLSGTSSALAYAQDHVRLSGMSPIWKPAALLEPYAAIEEAYDPVWGMYDNNGGVALLWSMNANIAVDTTARALHASITFSEGRRGSGITYTSKENRLWRSPYVKTSSTISFGTDVDIERERHAFHRSTVTCFQVNGQSEGVHVEKQWANCITNVQAVFALEQAGGFLTIMREGDVVLFEQRVKALLRRIRDRGLELGIKYGLCAQENQDAGVLI
jgi:hypothetical protein